MKNFATEFGTERLPHIPGFRLIERCGRGGSGSVYLAIDRVGSASDAASGMASGVASEPRFRRSVAGGAAAVVRSVFVPGWREALPRGAGGDGGNVGTVLKNTLHALAVFARKTVAIFVVPAYIS